jgi:hypothetical protein
MFKVMTISNLESGYLWFFCLLIINIIIISFIIGFYYYKTNQVGKIGATGLVGYPGINGDICNITVPCYKEQQE